MTHFRQIPLLLVVKSFRPLQNVHILIERDTLNMKFPVRDRKVVNADSLRGNPMFQRVNAYAVDDVFAVGFHDNLYAGKGDLR